jgi:ribosomal protein S18 acetylase RimI-like enzyme
MEISRAQSADAEAIARLVNLAFRRERFFVDDDGTNPEKVRELLQQGTFLLAKENGAVAGCGYGELHGERGYLGLLAVDPDRQRSGLGSQLMNAAEQYCRKARCQVMDLTIVNLRKELPEFYRRRGYSENGTEPFPAAAQARVACHLVRMSKALT